ncbi:hypothetical protein [Streptomyces sp. HNM0574]|uniref:bifunctional DNA primase/polymerase n=1 Tax=Streptomyces sp. HNM0574 TaxID=2714954 RepID=UPI00146DB8D5|nr:hypothetical protein [Streptomyces sp. HNM0574]NLU69714.1 hypothetical protein [Streptomyces sp. HNM0574]
MSGTAGTNRVVEWLVSAAPDPGHCRREWERSPDGMAMLPAGRLWDVLSVSSTLGYPTLDILTSRLDRPGPVLSEPDGARIGFFVPAGTAARWLGTGIRCAGRGTWIVVPYPGTASTGGLRWLVPPDGHGTLNDPALFELALHEAAARLADGSTGEPDGDGRGSPNGPGFDGG